MNVCTSARPRMSRPRWRSSASFRDAVYDDVREPMAPAVYVPLESRGGGTLLIRTAGDPLVLAPLLRREVDPREARPSRPRDRAAERVRQAADDSRAPAGDVVGVLCRRGAPAGGHRPLRRAERCRPPAAARDRHSHGARRRRGARRQAASRGGRSPSCASVRSSGWPPESRSGVSSRRSSSRSRRPTSPAWRCPAVVLALAAVLASAAGGRSRRHGSIRRKRCGPIETAASYATRLTSTFRMSSMP